MLFKYIFLGTIILFNQAKTETQRWNIDIEISEAHNVVFGQLDDIATDANNHIYVLDSKERTIYKFDEKGIFISTIGGPGQGPGEFEKPCSIYINSNNWLYVLDRNNRRVEVYDEDDKYRKTIKLINMPIGNRRNVATDNDDAIYISGYYQNNNTVLAKYNSSGKISRFYDLPITEYGTNIFGSVDRNIVNQYLVGSTACIDEGGTVYCSYSWPYIITKIERDGSLISSTQKDSEHNWTPFIFRTDQENGKMFGESTYSVKIFFVTQRYLANSVYVVDWTGNPNKVIRLADARANSDRYFKIKGKYSSLDIFNKELKCVDRITINERVRLFCADRKGRILGIRYNEEDVPSIVRYRINIKEEKS